MDLLTKDYSLVIISILLLIIGVLLPFKVIALLLTLIFFLIAIFRPKQALLVLIIYIPVRPLLITFQEALKGIADGIIFGALIAVIVQSIYRSDWRNLFKFRIFEWAFFIFLVIGAISGLQTGVEPIAIIFQYRAFILMYLVYYTTSRLSISMEDIKKFLWITFGMALVLCLHGIVEKLSMRELLLPRVWQEAELNNRNSQRIYGLVNNPNHLAVFITFALMSGMYLRELVKKSKRWLLDAGLVLMAGVFLLSDSKGVLLIAIALLCLYTIMTRNWRKILGFVLIVCIGQLLIVQPVHNLVSQPSTEPSTESSSESKNVKSSPEEQSDNKDSNNERSSLEQPGGSLAEIINEENGIQKKLETSLNSGRLMIFQNGFEVFLDHPIVGTGFGTFGDSATQSYGSPIQQKYNLKPGFYSDSQYIQIIAETGLFGVVAFGVFLLSMLYSLWKRRNKNVFIQTSILLLIAAFVGAGFYNIWEMDVFTLIYFMVLGYVLVERPINSYDDRIQDYS